MLRNIYETQSNQSDLSSLFAEFEEVSDKLKENGLCKRTLHKEIYLSSETLAGKLMSPITKVVQGDMQESFPCPYPMLASGHLAAGMHSLLWQELCAYT